MANDQLNNISARIRWFKIIGEDSCLETKGFVELDDFMRVINGSLSEAIDRVIFNDPATIVFWKDGTKTVVKAENEPFDEEKGLAMAIVKHANGNKSKYFNVFKKYCHNKEPVLDIDENYGQASRCDLYGPCVYRSVANDQNPETPIENNQTT